MAIRRSTALVNALAKGQGIKEMFKDSVLYIYSGTQPADADAIATGTQLLKYTLDGNAYTTPTKAIANITIGGAATGTLDTVTVGGMGFNLLSAAIDYTSDALVTAGLVVADINAKQNPLNITALQDGADVVLYAPFVVGAEINGLTFATTFSGSLTATASGSFAGGVTAVNGLNFSEAITDGVLSKDSGLWQATGLATGTAGYFRFVAAGSTTDGEADTDIRFDGSVGVSGTDLIIASTAIVESTVYTVSSATITEPAE